VVPSHGKELLQHVRCGPEPVTLGGPGLRSRFVAAFGIWASTAWARWLGVASAGINAVVQMLFIPAYPFLSLALFATDLLVIYGLIAYGGRQNAD
jgi:hypothetical protein